MPEGQRVARYDINVSEKSITSPGAAPGLASTSERYGASTGAGLNSGVAVGRGASAGIEGVAVGRLALAATGAIAVGESADASSADAVAIGHDAISTAQSVAIGAAASITNTGNVAVGYGARSEGPTVSSVAVGFGANALSLGSIALGASSVAAGTASVAIGNSANINAGEDFGIAIGSQADASEHGIALGALAVAAANTFRVGSTTAPINTVVIMSASEAMLLASAAPGDNQTGLVLSVNRGGVTTGASIENIVKIGPINSGPGGSGRALYIDNS
jgi:hypothetical protein